MASAEVIAPLVLSTIGSLQSTSLQNRQIEADRRQRLAEIRAQSQARERQRRAELKRAQASQRAHFGAQGRTATGGSAAAILNGLIAETRRQSEQDRQDAARGINAVDTNANLARRSNLLDTRFSIVDKVLNARTGKNETLLGSALKLLG